MTDYNQFTCDELIIPFHVDLGFHLIPSIVMLFDILLLSPPWTISALPAMGLSSCIAFGYWFWIEKCYAINGWYPYPLFELLDTKGRIGLFFDSSITNWAGKAVTTSSLSLENHNSSSTTQHSTSTSGISLFCWFSTPFSKMHSSVANASLRNAVLGGSRFYCCFTPFTPTTTFPQHSSRTKHAVLKRYISGLSTKCPIDHKNISMNSLARTQIPLQRAATPSSSRLSSQFIITSIKRNFSESAGLRARASKQTQSDTISKKSAAALLDWNTFFKLRASRRRYSLASSILTSFVSTAIGVQVLSTQDIDTLGAQVMGLDPFIVLGIATAACGALGWLIGPILGNTLWGLVNRQYRSGIAIKEKEFFDRIKRFRVDPSANSIANPVPDYYGEKIGSVQGYRQWLKDQRAYNRKKSRHIL
ncbi:hypothetical protein UA08_02441 [Talaromyces atroroseus]|uniref:Presequence translocated-associated motor subunit PAM17 n=1 Tax=Talaromyces atroroseus TaxID=1441469 RepID=A0A225B161_TALAT|nr:hypothetical protein UA08_02441 [Talaromyces atroroseus]OKL61719.1 hypothetical protein UA08_02441 [Talaromyces atroroseus]